MAHQIQHPSSLNPWQQYRQACSILSHTSRASNPAWYQQAIELDLQLHIRPDGPKVISAYFDRSTGQWSPGPKLNEEMLRDEEAFQPIADEILAHAKSNKVSAIGVVVHVADEFSTAELKPELDNPDVLGELREQAIKNPTEILEDSSANATEASFRVVPYAAAGSNLIGTCIAVSRQIDPALKVLRKTGEDNNFPIITQSLSAPLVALMGLPGMFTTQPEKPFVTILQYPWFTVLAFFNEHCDLKLIRTLQHRGMRQAANFRNALFTTSASLEFMDPDLFIVPLGEEIDTELEQNLTMNFPNSTVATLDPPKAEGVPDWAPELVISTNPASSQGVVTSMTFTSFQEEGWPFQDFLPMQNEQAEIYPGKGEMAMLRMTRLARIFILILALGGLGYMGLGIWNLMKTPEWSFDPNTASASQSKIDELNSEKRRAAHYDNLLQDRSKAWEAMEFFARTFPKDGNMLVSDMNYSARTDATVGQARASLVRTWKVTGFARDEALQHLNKLNTRSGIKEHFDKIAEITGSESYKTDVGNRSITVNIRTRENNAFREVPYGEVAMNDVSTYPFSFDLTIIQRFESNDPMALNLKPLR